jgi:hypothetical protein
MTRKKKTTETEEEPFALNFNYPILQILKLRDSLTEVLRGEFEGRAVIASQFDRLVQIVHEQLPGDIDYETVYESCRHLAGVHLTAPDLKQFAHRMAGNLDRLTSRRPVTPWVVQKQREWVPLQITAVKREYREKSGLGGVFTFFAMAGSVAGMTIRKWWSFKYCRYVSTKFKFSKPVSRKAKNPAKYPFSALEQLVTLRLYGLIDPELCNVNEPGFQQIKLHGSLNDWNRDQIRYRFRMEDEGYECPDDQPRDFLCHNCPRGYSPTEEGACRAATHAKSYEIRRCEHCDDDEAMFDPDWVGDVCVNCQRRAQSRRPS